MQVMAQPTPETLAALEHELAMARAARAAMAEILTAMSASPGDVMPVFEAVAHHARRLAGAMGAVTTRLEGDMLHLVAQSTAPGLSTGGEAAFASFPRPLDQSALNARAILTRAPVQIPDIGADPDYDATLKELLLAGGARSLLALPLLRGGEALGSILVVRPEAGTFDDELVTVLQGFAAQAAMVLENARLLEDTRTALARQTATAEVLEVISGSVGDTAPVFEKILDGIDALIPGGIPAVLVIDEHEQIDLVAWRGLPEAIARAPFPCAVSETPTALAIESRRVLHYPDVEADAPPPMQSRLSAIGNHSIALAPMIREGRGIGSLGVVRVPPRPFSAKELALLKTFSDQAAIAVQNARLFNDTREALEYQTATADVLRVLGNSMTDSQPVFEAILTSAQKLLDANDVAVILLQPDGTARIVAGHTDRPDERAIPESAPDPNSRTVELIRAREVWHVPDAAAATDLTEVQRAQLERYGNHSGLVVPLVWEGRGIGAIATLRFPVRPFSDKEIRLLQTFGDQAVIAIENARLFRETNEALERQTALSEVLRVIGSSVEDPAPVFDKVLDSCHALVDCEELGLFVVREDGLVDLGAPWRDYARQGTREFLATAFPRPVEGTLVEIATRERRTLHYPYVSVANDPSGLLGEVAEHFGDFSIVIAPMLWKNRGVGTITAVRTPPRPFAQTDIDLITTFAGQAVIAIENARLFRETNEALKRQTATAEVLRVISQSVEDTNPVFEKILGSCEHLFASDEVGVFLVGDDGQLHCAGYHGPSRNAVMATHPRPQEETATWLAIQRGEPVYFPDTAQATDLPASLCAIQEVTGPFSIVLAPMMLDGRGVGSIIASHIPPRRFAGNDIALLQTFADQAVIAIENSRLFHETNEALEQQTATAEVLREISSSVADTAPVFGRILDSCLRLFTTDQAGVYLIRDGMVHLEASRGAGFDRIRHLWPRPLSEQHAAIGRPAHFPSARALANPPPVVTEALAIIDDWSLMTSPMIWEGRLVGSITVTRQPPRPFTERERALLTTFADQAVIAIENSRLFHEIEDKSRQLEAANQHKSEFLANMSHELRTPLNAVIGFSEVLIERMFGDLNDKQEDYLKDIHASGRHLLSLINDILDLSKIEAGRMELEVEDFDVRGALDNALTLIRERAERHGIALVLEAARDLDGFRADQRKFKQVMLNLLSNAVKFTPDGGRITVRARLSAPDLLQVAVADTGIGIAPEFLETIFEEFRQAGGSYTNKQEGTGLGLSLTRRIVELHGGSIGVESEPGAGATFTFTLPRQP